MITNFSNSDSATIPTVTLDPTRSLILRSSGAVDVRQVTLTSTTASETITLNGLLEKRSANLYSSLVFAKASAIHATNSILAFLEGTPAGASGITCSQPVNGNTLQIGLTGHTVTYTFVDTLTATPNQIFIGATVDATLLNLKSAINAEAGAGTLYSTGTTQHPIISATNNGASITFTDRIGCNRGIAWVKTTNVSGLSISDFVGGSNGQLIASILPNSQVAGRALEFSISPSVGTMSILPPSVEWISNWTRFGGRPVTVLAYGQDIVNNITIDYELSDSKSGGLIFAGSETLSLANTTPSVLQCAESAEFMRIKVNNTANTTAGKLYLIGVSQDTR